MLGAPNVRFSGAIEQQSGGRSNSFDFLLVRRTDLKGVMAGIFMKDQKTASIKMGTNTRVATSSEKGHQVFLRIHSPSCFLAENTGW